MARGNYAWSMTMSRRTVDENSRHDSGQQRVQLHVSVENLRSIHNFA